MVLVQAAGVEPAASLGFASGFALLSEGWSPAIFFAQIVSNKVLKKSGLQTSVLIWKNMVLSFDF